MSADDDIAGDDAGRDGDGFESPTLVIDPLLPWQIASLGAALAARYNWHHATLLHGPAGTGLRRFALRMAQGLLCRSPRDGVGCGTCDACALFVSGNHPDFRLVERQWMKRKSGEEPRLREAIVIEQVRNLIDDFLYLTSHRLGAKVVVIHLAEEMNPAAANAVLKSLEEPPAATYFILVTHQLRLLKPTIVSRCARLPAPQPSAADAERWLAEQGARDPALVLAQAGGAPLKALAMLEPEYQSERARFLGRLADPRRMSIHAMGAEIESGPRALRKARLDLWIDWLATWTYDLGRIATLRAATAASTPTTAEPRAASGSVSLPAPPPPVSAAPIRPHYHVDFAGPLSALASKVAPVPVLRYHRSLLQDRALLAHPLNPRLVAENALHGYRTAVGG